MNHPRPLPLSATFLTGLLGGACATAMICGPWFLWADDPVPAPITASRDGTEVTMAGCRMRCTHIPATADQPTRITVQGTNPGAAPVTQAITVTATVSPPDNPMSRIGRIPRTVGTATASLVMPPGATSVIDIPLATSIPASAAIRVTMGATSVFVRHEPPSPVLGVASPLLNVDSRPHPFLTGPSAALLADAARN